MLVVAARGQAPSDPRSRNREGRTILFVRTKQGADRLARSSTARVSRRRRCTAARRRASAPARSPSSGRAACRVLVATDVAARGIHVDNIGLVVHVDPPADHKDYLHRAGRTARAGESGTVVTLVLPKQQRDARLPAGRGAQSRRAAEAGRPGHPSVLEMGGCSWRAPSSSWPGRG